MSFLDGYFAPPTCCVCNKSEFGGVYLTDGYVCEDCAEKCQLYIPKKELKTASKRDVRLAVKETKLNRERRRKFSWTRKVGGYIQLDETHRLWTVPRFAPDIYFKFDDMLSYQVIQDGNIITDSSGGLGSAIVGGVLFGTAGAMVGYSHGKTETSRTVKTQYEIQIITEDPLVPLVHIDLLQAKTDKASLAHSITTYLQMVVKDCMQRARQKEIQARREEIEAQKAKIEYEEEEEEEELEEEECEEEEYEEEDEYEEEPKQPAHYSVANEIREFKGLLDDGIITQEEFDAKKKQLLGL